VKGENELEPVKMEWIIPVVGAFRTDLQIVYLGSRQFGAGFENLSVGCYRCSVPGYELWKKASSVNNHDSDWRDIDKVVKKARFDFSSNDATKIKNSKLMLKSLSVYPEGSSLPFWFF